MPFDGGSGTFGRVARASNETRPRQPTLAQEPYARDVFTDVAALAAAVAVVCEHRLLKDSRIKWSDIQRRVQVMHRAHGERLTRDSASQGGRGRPRDLRARFAFELDRKDLLQTAHAPSPAELAVLWLLTAGIGKISKARLKDGVAVADLIETETQTMKKQLQRHGQQPMWFVAAPGEPAIKTFVAPDGSPVAMRRVANKSRRGLSRK